MENYLIYPGTSVPKRPCLGSADLILSIPVVPHKVVAEVSEEETYRSGWLL